MAILRWSAVAVACLGIAFGGVASARPAQIDDGWSLDIVDADGDVAATITAITVTTPSGRAHATDLVGSAIERIELATEDPDVNVVVDLVHDGIGATGVTISAGGPDGANVTSISAAFAATPDERFFGLGERAGTVDHRGEQVRNHVSDGPWTNAQLPVVEQLLPPPGYSDRDDATYFPVPWVLSSEGYGVLIRNHETSVVDLAGTVADSWSIDVAADRLELVVFAGATPAESLDRMLLAVGRQPEPIAPWIFGPWFQAADDEAAELAALADAGVPMSVVQTYTHYLPCGDHRGREADERARTERLHEAGLAVTTYVNPMVCVSFRDVYVPGSLTGAFTANDAGVPYRYRYFTNRFFDVVQFDFSSPAGVELFHSVLDEVVAAGYDGWMEDFGEYTPDDAVSADATPGPAMHNRYPELYHDAGMAFVESAPRPLVRFNRSGWTGAIDSSQVVWGGDPTTSWGFDGLQSSIVGGLGIGLSGVSVWGSDIGGFFTFDGEQPTPELLARWIEFGAFSPVMRLQAGGVSLVDEPRPTVLDPGVLPVWRRYSQLRTRLYPYVAGSQDEYIESGLPLMRHMVLAAPDEPWLASVVSQYLFGADLLVAPVAVAGATRQVAFLPAGAWVEWWPSVTMSDEGGIVLGAATRHEGGRGVIVGAPLEEIPLFVRSGSVIPLLPADVETLADYGDDDVVRLADRPDERTLLAFPDVDWSGPLGPGETMTATATSDEWTLVLDAAMARTYTIEASLVGLGDDFVPCAVTVDGSEADFTFDATTRVLSTTVDVPARGTLAIAACG